MVLRKMRTKMMIILWITIFAFIGLIVVEWGMKFSSSRRLTPKEEGLVGVVNKIPLNHNDYLTLLDNYKKVGMTQSLANKSAFNALIEEALINKIIEQKDLKLSDEEVMDFVKNNPPPSFIDDTLLQTNGKFDFDKYHQIIFDPANTRWLNSYAGFISSNIPKQILYQTIAGTVRPTTMEVLEELLHQRAEIKIEYAMIDTTQNLVDTNSIRAKLQDYYKAHLDKFNTAQPMINYVSFPIAPTQEDETQTQETADEILALLKEGANPETLKIQYNCKWVELSAYSSSAGVHLPLVKKDNGFYIPAQNDSFLYLPILPSYETITKVENRAEDFITTAKKEFEPCAIEYGLKVYKCLFDELKDVDLSYMNLKEAGKIIGPIQADTCIYVLQTLGMQKPGFNEVESKVLKEYLKEQALNTAKELFRQIQTNRSPSVILSPPSVILSDSEESLKFKKVLSENQYIGAVKTTELSGIDKFPEGEEFFIQALNIGKDSIGIVSANNTFYIVHCLERAEPSPDSLQKELPKFYSVWMGKESERIYKDWLNNLKQSAVIKDYRYKIW